jgi:hypothetical protein
MKTTHVSEGSLAAERRVVLSCDQKDFAVRDVIDTAWFRGDLQVDWEQLLNARACEELADHSNLDANDETLQSMSEEFRYERELLTAEETELWLAGHDVSEEDFTNYFLRNYWGKHLNLKVEPQKTDFPAATPELLELLRIDLILSGRFDRHVTDLSWRLAALLENGKALAVSLAEAEQFERSRFFERMGYTETELMDALERLGRDPQWFRGCLQMEAAYRRACDKLLTDEQRARLLTTLRLPLTRIEVESMMVQSADAASEAVLCLRENETSMSELARECDSTCERRRVFLGDCSEEMQQALLSASPGEILAPQREEDAFVVCRLISKTEPTLRDDEVIGRLDWRLLQTHFSELTRGCVRWAKGWEQIA